MKIPIQVQSLRGGVSKHPIFEFEGQRYCRRGLYWSSNTTRKLLHRAIWEANYGPIPEGHVIHHKDENRTNNHPDNLECMDHAEHTKLHHPDAGNRARAWFANTKKELFNCVGCGAEYLGYRAYQRRGHCSQGCAHRAYHRRKAAERRQAA